MTDISVTISEEPVAVSIGSGTGPAGATGSSGVITVGAPLTNSGTSSAAILGLSVGSGLSIVGGALTAVAGSYTLPVASASVLGGVKIGSGLSIDGSGVVTAAGTYTLPNATTSVLGGVIVGTGLTVTSGTVSVSYGTSGTTACIGDDARLFNARPPTAHNQAFSTITATPTTLAGYGIIDGQKTITSGTAAPSGGTSGDIYLRYSP